MSSLGLRAFSGITVGLVGSLVTVHVSLAVGRGVFLAAAAILFVRRGGAAPAAPAEA